MSSKEVVVDVRGKLCPVPVIESKKAMDASPEAVIVTVVDNEVSRDNVIKLGKSKKYAVGIQQRGSAYYIRMTPPGNDIVANQTESTATVHEEKEIPEVGCRVLLVTKDYLGEGSEELGRSLMKTFWFCLTEADVKPKKIFFINSGVKMVAEGSEHLENLQALVDAGVEIAACGICLDFYGLKESVKVGTITNMYVISDSMMTEAMITL